MVISTARFASTDLRRGHGRNLGGRQGRRGISLLRGAAQKASKGTRSGGFRGMIF